MNEQQRIQLLKQGEKDALEKLYVEYRNAFIFFAQKFCSNENDIVDAYQDAIIALQEKAIKGDLDDLKCSLKTYLFGIGKYLLYDTMRKQKRLVSQTSSEQEDYDYEVIATDFIGDEPSKIQLLLQSAFASLGKKCREVLSLFYYRGYTIDEIRDYLGYENKNVVKSQKSRCIKQLKDKINIDS